MLARVQGGAQGAWAPLEIEKQKNTRLVCMLYCIYCIIMMFPSFLIHEKTTFCYVMEGQKKLITLKILILICKLFLSFRIITTCSFLAIFFVRPYMLTEKVILRKQHQFPKRYNNTTFLANAPSSISKSGSSELQPCNFCHITNRLPNFLIFF